MNTTIPKISKVLDFFEDKYPKSTALDWDKTGSEIVFRDNEVKGIVIALDLTTDVLDKALVSKSNLIITHHPFIFAETHDEEFANNPYKKNIWNQLKSNQISLFSIHTNFDVSPEGMSYALAKELEIDEYTFLKSLPGFILDAKVSMKKIHKIIFKKLNLVSNILIDTKLKNKFLKTAFCPGALSIEAINELFCKKIELIVSSDVKWSNQILAKELGINIINVSHKIEQVFNLQIKKVINQEFNNLLKVYIE